MNTLYSDTFISGSGVVLAVKNGPWELQNGVTVGLRSHLVSFGPSKWNYRGPPEPPGGLPDPQNEGQMGLRRHQDDDI